MSVGPDLAAGATWPGVLLAGGSIDDNVKSVRRTHATARTDRDTNSSVGLETNMTSWGR
jgi:hypothetical protein